MARPLAGVLAVLLTGTCILACGHTGGVSTAGYVKGDYDDDDNGGNDADDVTVRAYGHEAKPGANQAVQALLTHYYAAAASSDGNAACALLTNDLKNGSDFTTKVPKAYAPPLGSEVLKNKSCAQVAVLLFESAHQQLVEGGTVKVTELRIEGQRGLAVLAFRNAPESEIPVERHNGAWKVGGFLATRLL